MSRAVAVKDRIAGDAYYTPPDLAQALVARLGLGVGVRVLEPSAGGGAFVRALMSAGSDVTPMDVDPAAVGLRQGHHPGIVGDFLDLPVVGYDYDWVVGNPPYRHAEEHIRKALLHAPRVAFLLRLGFLESRKRYPFWRDHPAHRVYVLAERPSFTGGGTDSAAYGWFVWDAEKSRHTSLEVISWRP